MILICFDRADASDLPGYRKEPLEEYYRQVEQRKPLSP